MFKAVFTLVAAALVALDQFVKGWAVEVLRPVRSIEVIPGLFSFSYVENRGAAFGIFQGNTRILSIITGVVLLAAIFWIYGSKLKSKVVCASVFVIIAGGIGNFIDRAFQGFVVDYLDFSAIFGFPVFNLADCCVVLGTAVLIVSILISEREENRENKIARESDEGGE